MALNPTYQQGIDYFDSVDHPTTMNFSLADSGVSRVFRVPGAIITDWLNYLLGWASGSFADVITREPPDEHPDYTNFYCVQADCTPAGIPTSTEAQDTGEGDVIWPYWWVTAQYKPLNFAVPPPSGDNEPPTLDYPDYYITRQLTINSQYLGSTGKMKWVSRPSNPTPPENVPQALDSGIPAKIVNQTELVLTHRMVPGNLWTVPNFDNITATTGMLNCQTFEGYPRGTVLYMGANFIPIRPMTTNSTYMWDLEHRFTILNNGPALPPPDADPNDAAAGWNYLWDAVYQRFDLISIDGTVDGGRLYQHADFSVLFPPNSAIAACQGGLGL